MRERPILFSSAMVQAILEGRKTQTRRVLKLDWLRCLDPEDPDDLARILAQCRYGVPGDRLWVRETWGLFDTDPSDGPEKAHVFYRASDGLRHDLRFQRWRPSIHMPRWASRLTLEVLSVRVERLSNISGPDCWAEGITHDSEKHGSVVHTYRELWESINGAGSWDANPFVWVVEFKDVSRG